MHPLRNMPRGGAARFRVTDAEYIEVIKLSSYPEIEVEEAIKCCPEDCIYWEEV